MPMKSDAGIRRPKQGSWGGSVIKSGDTYHMYFSDFKDGCSLDAWQSASQIRHATSKSATGPFEPADVVTPVFAHNPTVQDTTDGHYVIYHITGRGHTPDQKLCNYKPTKLLGESRMPGGVGDHMRFTLPLVEKPAIEPVNITAVESSDPALVSFTDPTVFDGINLAQTEKKSGDVLRDDQKSSKIHLTKKSIVGVRMTYASSPDGPWKQTWSTPYEKALAIDLPGHADGPFPELTCNNPAAYHNADGSVLLYCKWATHENPARGFRFAVFKAPHWKGPYKFEAMVSPEVSGEDPYVWYSKKRQAYHMIYHRMDPMAPNHPKVASTAWSKDGINWRALKAPHTAFQASIVMTNGKVMNTFRRERHQLLVDSEGEPQVLYNGVTVRNHDYSRTTAQEIRQSKSIHLDSDVHIGGDAESAPKAALKVQAVSKVKAVPKEVAQPTPAAVSKAAAVLPAVSATPAMAPVAASAPALAPAPAMVVAVAPAASPAAPPMDDVDKMIAETMAGSVAVVAAAAGTGGNSAVLSASEKIFKYEHPPGQMYAEAWGQVELVPPVVPAAAAAEPAAAAPAPAPAPATVVGPAVVAAAPAAEAAAPAVPAAAAAAPMDDVDKMIAETMASSVAAAAASTAAAAGTSAKNTVEGGVEQLSASEKTIFKYEPRPGQMYAEAWVQNDVASVPEVEKAVWEPASSFRGQIAREAVQRLAAANASAPL